jgi:hypothetical protein
MDIEQIEELNLHLEDAEAARFLCKALYGAQDSFYAIGELADYFGDNITLGDDPNAIKGAITGAFKLIKHTADSQWAILDALHTAADKSNKREVSK